MTFLCRILTVLTIFSCLPAVNASCRSNETHICWKFFADQDPEIERSLLREKGCWIQPRAEAEYDAIQFLRNNVMAFDIPKMETLGFEIGRASCRERVLMPV